MSLSGGRLMVALQKRTFAELCGMCAKFEECLNVCECEGVPVFIVFWFPSDPHSPIGALVKENII